AAPAVHTAHRILKEHRNVPYRNKFESPGLHRIVARSRFLTSGTDRTAIGPRHDGHDQAQAPCPCLIPLRIFVDKGLELLNTIQNSLQAHPVPNSCFGFCQIPKHRIRSGCAISGPSGFPPLRYFRYNSARPGRRTGQRWEPTRAPTQGPGPKRGVVHDAPFGSPQKNQRTSGLAQSDKSSRKYSPSLFLAPITPATRVPLLTYRADLTHRFPRGPAFQRIVTIFTEHDDVAQTMPTANLQSRQQRFCRHSGFDHKFGTRLQTPADLLQKLPICLAV